MNHHAQAWVKRNMTNILITDTPQNLPSSQEVFAHSTLSRLLAHGTNSKLKTQTPKQNLSYEQQNQAQTHLATEPEHSTEHQKFLQRRRKFAKPNLGCTRYLDSVLKNQSLLRRGAFELPIKNDDLDLAVCNKKLQKNSFESSTIIRRKSVIDKSNVKRSILPFHRKINKFDKTIQTHMNSYESLLQSERDNSGEIKIKIKNSMDRVLAAEMIDFKLSLNSVMKRTKSLKMKQ